MRRYLAESVKSVFESVPLDGALIIVGGEGFQHCFMRPSGVEKKPTNCPRCEKLGAETVVADLCNGMADAAREASPNAVREAWPYSAKHFWSAADDQAAFTQKLKPGTALLTEIEKDATVAFQKVSKIVDRTAAKGVIHKNQAARRKSRMIKRLRAKFSAPAKAKK